MLLVDACKKCTSFSCLKNKNKLPLPTKTKTVMSICGRQVRTDSNHR